MPVMSARLVSGTSARRRESGHVAVAYPASPLLSGNVRCLRGHAGRPRPAQHIIRLRTEEGRTCVTTVRGPVPESAVPQSATAPRRDPREADRPLRIAMLSYRSKPHCGGQGIYVRHLSRELAALGHSVEVLSGQPYPELEPGPVLTEVPSLDLYRDEDPFRTPRLGEYRDWIDVLEFAAMKTGAFPEPLTFSLRALRELRPRRGDFDVVHDNQVLGYGLLGIAGLGLPLVTSIHHPVSVDRRIELQAARGLSRLSKRRWYSFVRMQGRVARRVSQAGPILTVSESSRRDICRDFRTDPASVQVIPLGVDTRLFHPRPAPRVPGLIVAVASADSPMKGVTTLLRAFRLLLDGFPAGRGDDQAARLVVVSKPTPGGPTDKLVGELGLAGHVGFRHGMGNTELAELLAGAQIAVVPSLYEGFSLPAVEHMAS